MTFFMKLTSESKFFIGIIAATVFIVIAAVILLSQPQKPIAKELLIPASAPTRGNKNAKTWLVEFSDFQCPACKAFAAVVDELATKYPDTLFIAYHHFPLPQHPLALKAGIAAEAAGAQGKFWDMEKLLFANQDTLSEVKFAELAGQLKLDMTAFASASSDTKIVDKINTDVSYGNKLGLNATPTFFLNGVKLEVASPDELKKKVENALSINTN
jgi:protein-disulfide isomerase